MTNLVAGVTLPPDVVTLMAPPLPFGTVTTSWVSPTTVYRAGTPPTVTPVVCRRFVPRTLTSVPTLPLQGVKVVTFGAGGLATVTVNRAAEVTVPSDVVTVTTPLTAPTGTFAVTSPDPVTVNTAGLPPMATAVAPLSSVPVTVTVVPTGPLAGENPVIDARAGLVTV